MDECDNDLNVVVENGVGGEEVGIIVFVEDFDVIDKVIYLIEDLCFDIDLDIGVLIVKDGVSFDFEQIKIVDVEIMVMFIDGLLLIGIFIVNILDVNEVLDFDFDLELGVGVLVMMIFVEEGVGYSNIMGVFYMDVEGNLVGGEIVWVDQNVLIVGDLKIIYVEGFEVVDVGYFLILDGVDMNFGLVVGDKLIF